MEVHLTPVQIHDQSEHYIALLLSLLGVIQGLALNHLADKISILGSIGDATSRYMRVAVYAMCFFIIVRVFQTYSSAAFEPTQQHFDVIDLTSIFAVGLLQYWVIDAIDGAQANASAVLFRVIFLATSAVVLHFITGLHIYDNPKPDIERDAKITLQFFNVAFALIIALLAYLGYRSSVSQRHFVVATAIALLLATNIAVSLRYTNLI